MEVGRDHLQKYTSTFKHMELNNLDKLGQQHASWWPGSLRRQDINRHAIDYISLYC